MSAGGWASQSVLRLPWRMPQPSLLRRLPASGAPAAAAPDEAAAGVALAAQLSVIPGTGRKHTGWTVMMLQAEGKG